MKIWKIASDSPCDIILKKLQTIIPSSEVLCNDNELINLLAINGHIFPQSPPPQKRVGFSNMGGCHKNLTRFLRKYPNAGVIPCTGYVPWNNYQNKTIWIDHSWGLYGYTIIEFTPEIRQNYWGCEIPLSMLQWQI